MFALASAPMTYARAGGLRERLYFSGGDGELHLVCVPRVVRGGLSVRGVRCRVVVLCCVPSCQQSGCARDAPVCLPVIVSVVGVAPQMHDPIEQSCRIPVSDLARVTALACFREMDRSSDGQLSYEDFRQWYSGAGEQEHLSAMAELAGECVPCAVPLLREFVVGVAGWLG